MVRALAKARRWQSMLENGAAATIKDLARQEGVDKSFMARTLRLNSLAPEIVESILDGSYPDTISLESLRSPFSLVWKDQKEYFF
ncbi:putative LacI family regulatory protein [Magnetofaba australis IT-1]|uniref:Putative LacI family regulatory protein n=1 Tax=Magnetofaba australis IT-1 TaxID=1434232 RepID=A0A1Y2K9L9_9PROT|nr:putative LacI family regulatory protein [Magnetofaba australis IT-1]